MTRRKPGNRPTAPRARKARRDAPGGAGRLPVAILASVVVVVMVVLALWCWGNTGQIALYYETSRPGVTAWAVCAGAVAMAAVAQLVLVFFVTSRICGPSAVDRVVSLAAGLAAVIALACTVAFAAAGR